MYKTFATAALVASVSSVQLHSRAASKQPHIPSWNEVLDLLDKDGNQQISWSEVQDFLDQVGVPAAEQAEYKHEFEMADTDNSGEVDKAEFEAAMADAGALGQRFKKHFSKLAQMKSKLPPSWEDILEVLDKDGNKQVSWGEILQFIKRVEEEHGVKIPKEDRDEIKKIFDMVDADGSGEISKEEFEDAVADSALGQRSQKSFKKLVQVKTKLPPSWEDILAVLDKDGNKEVSWDEVLQFIKQIEDEHNVKVSKEDRKEIKKVFDMVDADNSGEISKKEFEDAMADAGALGQRSKKAFSKLAQMKTKQPPSWEDILEVLDEDGNGQVSWKEVEGFMDQIEKEHGVTISKEDRDEVKKVFDMVDTDKSGEIDKEEFEASLADAGALGQKSKNTFSKLAQMKQKSKQGPPTWEDVLEVLDKDGNGRISWGEVLQFIKQIEEEHNVKISKEDKKAIKAGFDAVDTDGSGEVDKAEFEAAVEAEEGLAVLKKWM